MLTACFTRLLRMSFAAIWLILAILLLRLIFQRAPRRILCLLWTLAAIRLLIPFSLQSEFSLQPSPAQLTAHLQTTADTAQTTLPPIMTFTPEVPIPQNPTDIISEQEQSSPPFWPDVAAVLWPIGAAGMIAYALISTLMLRRRTRISIGTQHNIRICDHIGSPFILGIFSPVIYLPSRLDALQSRYVIAHEKAHISRGDHIWKPLGFAILTLHWFNPLVWVGYAVFCRDIELACDERVVRTYSLEERKTYSAVLLACSSDRPLPAPCPLAFGEIGVKARIGSILRGKRPAIWVTALALVLGIIIALCFLTDPSDKGSAAETTDSAAAQPHDTTAAIAHLNTAEPPAQASLDIVIADTVNAPDDVIEQAKAIVRQHIQTFNEYGQSQVVITGSTYYIEEAKIFAIHLIPTGTAGLTDSVELYQMECHLRPSQSENVFLAGSMTLDNGWFKITDPYFVLYHDHSSASRLLLRTISAQDIGLTYSTPDMLAKYGSMYTAAAMEIYAEYTAAHAPAPLTPESAEQFISETLRTLALTADGQITFTLPASIPVAEDSTQLYITLTATFGGGGSYSLCRMLDYADGWSGGQTYLGRPEPAEGELQEIMLRVAFMTPTENGGLRQYAANYIKLTHPFANTPAMTDPYSVSITSDNQQTQLHYTLRGINARVTLALPDELSLIPLTTEANALPAVGVLQNGKQIGSLNLFSFAASDQDALSTVDPAQNTLPMPIFAIVALSNHATYTDYTVRRATATSASATAVYRWQELDGTKPAAAVPEQQADSILAYNWAVMPYFLVLTLPDGTLTDAQLADLAAELIILRAEST